MRLRLFNLGQADELVIEVEGIRCVFEHLYDTARPTEPIAWFLIEDDPEVEGGMIDGWNVADGSRYTDWMIEA